MKIIISQCSDSVSMNRTYIQTIITVDVLQYSLFTPSLRYVVGLGSQMNAPDERADSKLRWWECAFIGGDSGSKKQLHKVASYPYEYVNEHDLCTFLHSLFKTDF